MQCVMYYETTGPDKENDVTLGIVCFALRKCFLSSYFIRIHSLCSLCLGFYECKLRVG